MIATTRAGMGEWAGTLAAGGLAAIGWAVAVLGATIAAVSLWAVAAAALRAARGGAGPGWMGTLVSVGVGLIVGVGAAWLGVAMIRG